MKVKQLIAFSIAISVVFLGVKLTPISATGQNLSSLQGVVRFLVVEGTEEQPSHFRFFLEQCDGAPCNFASEQSKQATSKNPISKSIDIDHIYLTNKSGKIDLRDLVNKEVILRGESQTAQNFFPFGKKTEGLETDFNVLEIEKVVEEPTVNHLVAPPLNIPPASTGQRKVLAMLVNFQVAPTMPYSQQQIKDWVFTGPKSARKFFEDSSFYNASTNEGMTLVGNNDPSGDVTPWLSLSGPQTNCAQNMFNEWRIQADNLAEAQGFSKLTYQTRLVLYAPIPGCSLGAQATVAAFGDQSAVTYVFIQLPAGSQEILDTRLSALVHEIEHNLGQGAHSNGQQTEGGPILEYFDRADPLASSVITFNSNVNRIKFGWTSISQMYPAIEYRKPGGQSYMVRIQTPSQRTKGIGPSSPPIGAFIVLRDMNGNPTGEAFVLERRRSTGLWDQFGTDVQAYNLGLAIRKVSLNLSSGFNGSVIQDTTPATACCKDAPLVPGPSGSASWTSNLYGVTIKAYTGSVSGMLVEITLGGNYPEG